MKRFLLSLIIIIMISSCNNEAPTPKSAEGTKYKYTIDPHGSNTVYYTNDYQLDAGCVRFTGISINNDVPKSYTLCGSFTIK